MKIQDYNFLATWGQYLEMFPGTVKLKILHMRKNDFLRTCFGLQCPRNSDQDQIQTINKTIKIILSFRVG